MIVVQIEDKMSQKYTLSRKHSCLGVEKGTDSKVSVIQAIFFRNNVFRKVNMDFFANFLDCDLKKQKFCGSRPIFRKDIKREDKNSFSLLISLSEES